MKCHYCGKVNCDNDCEELAMIYRQQQRDKLRDIDIEEIICEWCGKSYAEGSHEDCAVKLDW